MPSPRSSSCEQRQGHILWHLCPMGVLRGWYGMSGSEADGNTQTNKPKSWRGVTSESPRLTLSHCKVLSTWTHGDGYQRNVCWLPAHQLKENVVLTFTLEGKKIASLSLFLSFPFWREICWQNSWSGCFCLPWRKFPENWIPSLVYVAGPSRPKHLVSKCGNNPLREDGPIRLWSPAESSGLYGVREPSFIFLLCPVPSGYLGPGVGGVGGRVVPSSFMSPWCFINTTED